MCDGPFLSVSFSKKLIVRLKITLVPDLGTIGLGLEWIWGFWTQNNGCSTRSKWLKSSKTAFFPPYSWHLYKKTGPGRSEFFSFSRRIFVVIWLIQYQRGSFYTRCGLDLEPKWSKTLPKTCSALSQKSSFWSFGAYFWIVFGLLLAIFFVYSTWEISNSILIWTRESLEHHICTEISETQKISYNKAARNRENSSAVVLFGSIAFEGHAMRLYGDTQ